MIESIHQIGKAVMQGSSGKRAFLESLAKEAPRPKNGNPSIAILKLNTRLSSLNIEVREIGEYSNTVEDFLWLGNAASSASDQDRLTTDNLSYLVSQTIPNLLSVTTLDTPFYKTLQVIFETFFIDIGEATTLGISGSATTYRRSRYLLNLPKLNLEATNHFSLQQLARAEGNIKGLPNLVANEVMANFKDQLSNDRMLFTLEVDGELLSNNVEYINYLENVYVGDVFEDAVTGCCHLTGETTQVTANLTRLKFKYYITDKLGFASGTSKAGFESNLTISKDAYLALLVGERFVERMMGFYLAGMNGYVLPNYYYQEMDTHIITKFEEVKSRTEWHFGKQMQLDREILRKKVERDAFSLSLLFYKRAQASFKVVRLIQDVPEYRLNELRAAATPIKELGDSLFGTSNNWELTLQKMYYLLPVRKSGTDYLSKNVLEFYDLLITGGLIDKSELIPDFMELVRVYQFETFPAYHLSQPSKDNADYSLLNYLAQTNLLLAFLRDQDQLKEENVSIDYLESIETEEQKQYLGKLSYSSDQAALYLVGYLIGRIANAQHRLGTGDTSGKKVILNKINYQGMTLAKVKGLLVSLHDKLRQYKILDFNETLYYQALTLLELNNKNWRLTPTENVYYILSGYAHSTFLAIQRGKNKQDLNHSQGGDDI